MWTRLLSPNKKFARTKRPQLIHQIKRFIYRISGSINTSKIVVEGSRFGWEYCWNSLGASGGRSWSMMFRFVYRFSNMKNLKSKIFFGGQTFAMTSLLTTGQSIIDGSDFYGLRAGNTSPVVNEFPFHSEKAILFDKNTNTMSTKVEKCSHESKSSEESFFDANTMRREAKRTRDESCRHWFSHFLLWKLSKSSHLRLGDQTHTTRVPNLTHFQKNESFRAALVSTLNFQSAERREVKDTLRSRITFLTFIFIRNFFHPLLRHAGLHGSLSNKPSPVLMISKTLQSAYLLVWINKQQQRSGGRNFMIMVGVKPFVAAGFPRIGNHNTKALFIESSAFLRDKS